jgi:predicted Zn-ribbon and HTH transcriptional regulator
MAANIPPIDNFKDPDCILIRLIRADLYVNGYMTISEHVEHAVKSFEIVEKSLKSDKTGVYNNPNVMNCPDHGWVFCIRRNINNRCPRCFNNRIRYRKRKIIEAANRK